MKHRTFLFALLGAALFTGCATGRYGDVTAPYRHYRGSREYSGSYSSSDSGVDPITQAGSDAISAATNEQSNDDVRAAADAANAASAAQ